MPTIQKQGTIEQKKKYLEPARQLQLIGTYAQTELGHGNTTVHIHQPFSRTFFVFFAKTFLSRLFCQDFVNLNVLHSNATKYSKIYRKSIRTF